jgi:predicted house-cleaning noncanonical NTP pyrophosphatase (MazG superfamily)
MDVPGRDQTSRITEEDIRSFQENADASVLESLRDYSDEEIEEFLRDDELNDQVLAVVRRFEEILNSSDSGR